MLSFRVGLGCFRVGLVVVGSVWCWLRVGVGWLSLV